MSVTGGQYVIAQPLQDLIEAHIYDGTGNAMQIWRELQKDPIKGNRPSINQVKKVWNAQQIQQTVNTGPRAPARKRIDYDKTVSQCVGCSVQGDLAQMTKLKKWNKLKQDRATKEGQWGPPPWPPNVVNQPTPPW